MKEVKILIIKFLVMCMITIILASISAIVEVMFNVNIDRFMFFTMGYLSCIIFNWRWLFNAKKEEGR